MFDHFSFTPRVLNFILPVKPPAARSTRSTASSPLDPPIDDTLTSCVERAQEGWDVQYLTDELQVVCLTSSEVRAF